MAGRPVQGNAVARRFAPAILAACVAIAAAAAGFHELPNAFQLVSTLVAALSAALATRHLKKIRSFGINRFLRGRVHDLRHGGVSQSPVPGRTDVGRPGTDKNELCVLPIR
ncbi:hypothetical protein AB0L41_01010 [Amycolatopsis mediterranei]|uniref:hypothetical protein n=1 Tax=Amycolatopsis mediterranei TaxID=33910 RepID=UPI003449CFA1